MNGTIYDELKKKGDSKKRDKLKFFVGLILSNFLVAMICLSFGESAPLPTKGGPRKVLHPHFKMIVIPLSLLMDLDPDAREIPVTLMTKQKKILIQKAYLHEEVQKRENLENGPARFRIEIPETDVLKLSADPDVEMIAMPELSLKPKLKASSNKRVSHYEIDL